MAVHSTRFPPYKFRNIGIPLLRHHRTARRKRVGQFDEPELTARPENQFFSQPAEVHTEHRAGGKELNQKVTIRNRIETVLTDSGKIQQSRYVMAINRQ